MKRIGVFLGSNPGVRPEYRDAAKTLGAAIATRHLTLVYGGGNIGLMGVLADAALGAGGGVIGVIPAMLSEKEYAHSRLTKIHVVSSMNERKTVMASLSDGFITLPGGMGTLDELFEMLTWAQLGVHGKPSSLVNVAGYYDALLRFLDDAVAEGFLKARQRALLTVEETPEAALARMLASSADYRAPG